ncbi:MAG: tRNA epoxyqueuosine(34) reductase QueG [Anaerolineae bacterium]|nr:tRNA epoxyqueuosine(34) reductase QueG [Anaerolineae bacterium]
MEQIRSEALKLGFDLAGIAPISPVPHVDAYRDWIAHGYHGEMGYMARPDRVERRENPGVILPGAKAVVCVGLNYYPGPLPGDLAGDASRGLIANYAWGIDYHDLMQPHLEELAAFIRAQTGSNATTCAYVDTGPILERAYAAAAGLGFIGKNTCLIHPKMGSWLFLGQVLTDAELAPMAEASRVDCGTCRRCLDACPTGALIAPYTLDARRCISYLTIELKGAIPRELRPLMGNHIYGCDTCQQVCPWQRFASPTRERSFHAEELNRAAPPLAELVEMDEAAFRQRYAGSPIARIGRGRLLRNAAVALGNWGDERAIEPLAKALQDADPLVREHAAWALGHTGGKVKHEILENALKDEAAPYVRKEIQAVI